MLAGQVGSKVAGANTERRAQAGAPTTLAGMMVRQSVQEGSSSLSGAAEMFAAAGNFRAALQPNAREDRARELEGLPEGGASADVRCPTKLFTTVLAAQNLRVARSGEGGGAQSQSHVIDALMDYAAENDDDDDGDVSEEEMTGGGTPRSKKKPAARLWARAVNQIKVRQRARPSRPISPQQRRAPPPPC